MSSDSCDLLACNPTIIRPGQLLKKNAEDNNETSRSAELQAEMRRCGLAEAEVEVGEWCRHGKSCWLLPGPR